MGFRFLHSLSDSIKDAVLESFSFCVFKLLFKDIIDSTKNQNRPQKIEERRKKESSLMHHQNFRYKHGKILKFKSFKVNRPTQVRQILISRYQAEETLTKIHRSRLYLEPPSFNELTPLLRL